MKRLALVVVSSLAVAACGGGDDDGTPGGAQQREPKANGGKPTVDMTDQLTFEPRTITVSAGQKVTWRNVGNVAHTVTTTKSKAANPEHASVPRGAKEFDSGFVNGGKSFSRTFTEPGTYRYFCIPHENARMIGTVVVKP